MLYQGHQAMGAAYNLGFNYPFLFTNSFPSPGCTAGSASCANNGYTLEKGFRRRFGTGVTIFFSVPTLVGQSIAMKTTYAMSYNLTMEHALSSDMVASFVVSPDDGHLVAEPVQQRRERVSTRPRDGIVVALRPDLPASRGFVRRLRLKSASAGLARNKPGRQHYGAFCLWTRGLSRQRVAVAVPARGRSARRFVRVRRAATSGPRLSRSGESSVARAGGDTLSPEALKAQSRCFVAEIFRRPGGLPTQ